GDKIAGESGAGGEKERAKLTLDEEVPQAAPVLEFVEVGEYHVGGAEIAAGGVGVAQDGEVVERVEHEHAALDPQIVEQAVESGVVARAAHRDGGRVHAGEGVSYRRQRGVGRGVFEHEAERFAKNRQALGGIGAVELGL